LECFSDVSITIKASKTIEMLNFMGIGKTGRETGARTRDCMAKPSIGNWKSCNNNEAEFKVS